MSFTIWFTGLPGSGKSTIAGLLKRSITDTGRTVELIESDDMAVHYHGVFPFDTLGRRIITLNMAVCAEHLNKHAIPVLAASTAPLRKDRHHIRTVISSLLFVYCNTSEKTVRERDPKGLYAMADMGILPDFPGPGGLYEPPLNPDVELNTEEFDPHRCVGHLMSELRKRGWL
jgi:adenylylsulfate kinase-like enzyme